MASQPIEPLRIQKGSPTKSPNKFNAAANKPLSELSPMAIRRNSPSFPGNKVGLFKGGSSPCGSSPQVAINTASPRLFWQGRDPTSPSRENQSPHESHGPGLVKRSSIEKLKQASRVKNSNMFAKEQSNHYDPSKPVIVDRPLATGRPLTIQVQGNAYGGQGLQGFRQNQESDSETNFADEMVEIETTTMGPMMFAPLSPSKNNTSPAKSSLSKKPAANARYSGFDPETGIWADDDPAEKQLPEGRVLHRRGKSVTFDQAPPQVNEYEMTTPDPSTVADSREGSYDSGEEDEDISFERGSSLDREDSFDASLEDTDKTPVVLPEDWRFMSPEIANTDLSRHEEDVFAEDEYGSPAPTAQPGLTESRPHQTSVNSVDSNGQPRPLPPLPQTSTASPGREGFSSAIERMSNAQRSLPTPPQAPIISKSEIRRMSGGSMSLEERLRLIMLKEQEQEKPEAEKQRERRMRRAGSKDPSPTRETTSIVDHEEAQEAGAPGAPIDEAVLETPHISRESILRRLRSQQDLHEKEEEHSENPRWLQFDPDVPIPSLEDPTQNFVREEAPIKQEDLDDNDLYSIPDLYSHSIHSESDAEESASQYSQIADQVTALATQQEGQDTPRAQSPAREMQKKVEPAQRASLPDFADFGRTSSFDLDLSSYMTPPTETNASKGQLDVPRVSEPALPDLSALRASIQTSYKPDERLEPPRFSRSMDDGNAEPGTPDSVIRHPIDDSTRAEIASPEATVKAPGSRLSVRPSPAPADTETMAATRRQVSGQVSAPAEISNDNMPSVPLETFTVSHEITNSTPSEGIVSPPSEPTDSAERESKKRVSSLVQLDLPGDQTDEGLGLGLEKEFDRVLEAQKVEFERSLQRLYYPFHGRFPSSELPEPKDAKMKNPLEDVPVLPKPRGGRALPADDAARGHVYPTDGSLFANRSPYRQRGYLMRQNTKVVVASERPSQDENRPPSVVSNEAQPSTMLETNPNEVQVSPRKTSQPTWTAEPWNGRSRRKSIRVGGEKSPIKRKPVEGPAPPLPGQASNVQESLAEEEIVEDDAEDLEDGAERGRVFVKVIGVKDLDLPLPDYERTSFALTLDNGLHCVTTAWLDLARNAPIGQEFELVVLNDLEFQLTLQMKLQEPKVERPVSPTKTQASPKKPGAFGRLFGSPKKRKESEAKAQQEAAKRPATPPSAYEMVQGLVAKDGSFARAYVALSEHEKQAYGRPYSVDIMCFNEWAMEEVQIGSSRSKKAVTELQRRPPYPIGKLELQLLYIPKPKGCKDEDMPKSMNGAVRELKDAEAKMTQQTKEFEGHLSQQGGDCPYWRRRFFKLSGTKLTAYHEATLQPRATINLAKAVKLIDDKTTLTQKETSTKGGGRRKSAFAEEEEGYMFIEEGFRIRFANGEVIDFYADSPAEKDEWMKVLSHVAGKGASGPSGPIKPWAETVLRREKSVMAKDKRAKAASAPAKSAKNDALTREQTVVRNPNAANKGLPMLEQSSLPPPHSHIPSPTRPAPRPQAHTRTESHQSTANGSKSQANSPVKSRMTAEERRKKTRSMIDMQFK